MLFHIPKISDKELRALTQKLQLSTLIDLHKPSAMLMVPAMLCE